MRLDYTAKMASLDWDNINLQEALVRFEAIRGSPNVIKATLSRSPRKNGYHVRVFFHFSVRVASYRFNHSDDPRRLLHDLFNRPGIHDILWKRKTVAGVPYIAEEILVG